MAPGYQLKPNELQIELQDGEQRGGLRIELPSGLSLSGRVIGPHGEPFADVAVSLHGGPGTGTRTAADGSFIFRAVAPGTYWLTASPPDASPEGAPRLGHGILENVPAGSSGLELVLPLLVEITGRVVEADGEPLEHALVVVTGKLQNAVVESVLSGPDGAFRLEVPHGLSVDLRALRTEPNPGSRLGRRSLDLPAGTALGVAAGSTGIVLRLP
jgi:hypothetical protein